MFILYAVPTYIITLLSVVVLINSMLVETIYGTIQGRRNQAPNGKKVIEFLGVPFAKPPLGELRFKPPVPPVRWSEVKNATELSNGCMQKVLELLNRIPYIKPYIPTTAISEDCLYLNIFLPDSINSTDLAVMIFFHGGGFYMGSNSAVAYDGGVLATEENVIVVIPNYRLASFGFLSLDDKEVTGNMGLLDQQMAMMWVYENIQKYGGNKEKIVIYGQSAGAASVNLHLTAPSSWKYFNGAIMQSGFMNDDWAFNSRTKNDNYSKQLAGYLNCIEDSATETLQCLQKKDAEEIIENEPYPGIRPGVFSPVIDGSFLTEHPFDSYAKGNFKPCNIIAGTLRDDGSIFIPFIVPDHIFPFAKEAKPTYQTILSLLKTIPLLNSYPFLNKMAEYIYTGLKKSDDYKTNLNILKNIITDVLFTCHMKHFLSIYSETPEKRFKKYSYLLSYKESGNKLPSWFGVAHGSDLPFIFGHSLNKIRNVFHEGDVSSDDLKMSKRIMRYWANFAKKGNPSLSPTGQLEEMQWPEHTTENEEIIMLRPNSTMVRLNYRSKYCVFLNELIPSILRDFQKALAPTNV